MNFLSFKSIGAILFLCCCSLFAQAQITEVQLGVNGLTCSQCTRSVEMRIRKLPFVKDVAMNLEHTEGKVYFKAHDKVDIDKVAQAVYDAGFSVRYLQATFLLDHVKISPNYCWNFNGDEYQFIKVPSKQLSGTATFTFIGNKFLPKKDLKKWKPYLKNSCSGSGKTYFITI